MSYSDNPEQPYPPSAGGGQFKLATWPQRAVGGLIDYGIATGIYLVGFMLRSNLLVLIFALASFAFIIWNMVRQGQTGQTIGKGIVGLKLVGESTARPVGVGLSIGRYFLHVIDALPCYIGFLAPLWDSKRQTFADKLLQTVVIDEGNGSVKI